MSQKVTQSKIADSLKYQRRMVMDADAGNQPSRKGWCPGSHAELSVGEESRL